MNLELFLSPEYENYQIRVIAPTHTYGTVTGYSSVDDFEVDYDEYDMTRAWKYLVVVENKTIATFNHLEETITFIENHDFGLVELD